MVANISNINKYWCIYGLSRMDIMWVFIYTNKHYNIYMTLFMNIIIVDERSCWEIKILIWKELFISIESWIIWMTPYSLAVGFIKKKNHIVSHVKKKEENNLLFFLFWIVRMNYFYRQCEWCIIFFCIGLVTIVLIG